MDPVLPRLLRAVCTGALLLPLVSPSPVGAQAQNPSMLAPRVGCDALPRAADFGGIEGAPTQILSATPVAGTDQAPAYCDVKGYIAPQDQFEMRLPDAWNQRYLQSGCGGLCGIVAPSADCNVALGRNFATAFDNQGHVGASPLDGTWAGNDEQLRNEFGYLAEHRLVLSARAILQAYYGQQPRYSYFDGCSDGGMEGLRAAQQYPADFDGIVAGAPAAIRVPLDVMYQVWLARINVDAQGGQILTPDGLRTLHDAVMSACDEADGLIDGLLSDPRTCHFDPGQLECGATSSTTPCLTAQQVEVARKAYSGPVTDDGTRLYPGGEQYGSELAWGGWFVQAGPAPLPSVGIGGGMLRFGVFNVGEPGPRLQDWAFTRENFDRLRPAGSIYNATNPDLTAFRDHGGKLIMYHGWADQAISPIGTLAYYQAVQDRMGGLAATQQFARLFMFPGMYHCQGGYGPNRFDMVGAIVDWVEQGQPPERVVASLVDEGDTVLRTRPAFPYPQMAQYTGVGSLDSADSYVAATPTASPNDSVHWAGEDLFGPPG
jgi:feruloyl esterase